MAKYTFTCDNCLNSEEKYASVSTESTTCSKCGKSTRRELPMIGSKKVTEKVDDFLNIRHEEDHKKQLEDRRTEFFWNVEVPRFIESGTYSLETCLSEGWLVYNEKGELVIGKPKKIKR
jgi:hypothetical protein